eukprot:CAMPEP_0117421256 /NCGR_PEP_ID=MMETSP0758-20121206/2402_1 /TAXON_ID=63605 /ORGANISM="Percolomonas cosmopolitus, Strain AE-1 (ATCC 50343)" /LENGTH=272 /DNA_ID=CAMNT_0005203307 /DNA_START=5223 /DNA_END=6042 /DNA_ORIENTATION=+
MTTISNCFFSKNVALQGGAIYGIESGNVTIQNCVFTKNRAQHTKSNDGGAIKFDRIPQVMIQNSTFTENDAQNGGALSINNVLTIQLVDKSGGLFLDHCHFDSNNATYGGAVSLSTDYLLNVKHSTFSKNRASMEGGAIYATGTSLLTKRTSSKPLSSTHQPGTTIDSTRFIQNTANSGGAISSLSTLVSMQLLNCDFIENTAAQQGGTINGMLQRLQIDNSYFFRSSSNKGGAIYALSISDDTEVGFSFSNSIVKQCTAVEMGGSIILLKI